MALNVGSCVLERKKPDGFTLHQASEDTPGMGR